MKTKVYKNNPYERQFLKDFEILVEHTPEEEDEGLYTAANFKKAKEQMADTYVLDELGMQANILQIENTH